MPQFTPHESLHGFIQRYDTAPEAQINEDLGLLRDILEVAQERTEGLWERSEALLLCEALLPLVLQPPAPRDLCQQMAQATAQAMTDPALTRKWQVDPAALQAKMDRLDPLQALSLWHWVKQFWMDPHWDHDWVARTFRCPNCHI